MARLTPEEFAAMDLDAPEATEGAVELPFVDAFLAQHLDLRDTSDPTPPEEEGEMFYGYITIRKARELNALLAQHKE